VHVIGTAGHVDHGKSTLVQRLTGIDPDRFAEEKRRGLTIDLGFAWLTLPSGREVGIVDVPGHERFIKNMLAGAGGISICMFVVAANEGWKPQSAEHLGILDILGISHAVVALTKADLVDADELELAQAEVEERLAVTSLRGSRVVPVSATSGLGVEELVTELDRLVQDAPAPADRGRPRLWVDRVFTIAGAGTVVTGTLAGGSFRVGDEVEVVGSHERRRARVRTIQTHKKEVTEVGPGNRVALNLAGLERQGAERGDAVVAGRWETTQVVDALIRVLPREVTGASHELQEKGAHLLYVGAAETPVRLRLLDEDVVRPGEDAFARLHLRDPLPLARDDRFVLRDAGRVMTFGGGIVLDPRPPSTRRVDRDLPRLLARLADATPEEAFVALVDHAGEIPLDEALLRSGGTRKPPAAITLDDIVVSKDRFDDLASHIERALRDHHATHRLEPGMPREALRAAIGLDAGQLDALLEQVPSIEHEGALVRMKGHRVALDPAEEAARSDIIERIERDGFAPPLARELPQDQTLLRSLERSRDLVRIGDFYLTAAQATDARAKVRTAIEERGPLTVAEIRDLLGTTRKYAVPLCEWLDATGATRRLGDKRALGPHA